ncbi:homeobox protein Wariai [Colletotrichum liriopes]|uniref:Homeobox protein Wariai n=1 Tax=Colletotrichum liriopes TaxID=708192 RepID=A0AA37GWN6_9PEZI|nr:homeobox protein Wariai [Colletotrichum liriopes]
MNAQGGPLTPTSSYSGETLFGHGSPPGSWSPSYSVASTLANAPEDDSDVRRDDVGPAGSTGSAGSAVNAPAVHAWLTSTLHSDSSSATPSPDNLGIRSTTVDAVPDGSTTGDQRQEYPLTPRSSTSDDTAVGSPAHSWSSGVSEATIHPSAEERLIDAILRNQVDQVEALCLLGVSISVGNSEILYDACVKGTEMINALAPNPRHNFAGRVANAYGDYIFHAVLRTPACVFYRDGTADRQPANSRKLAVVCNLLDKKVDLSLRDRIGDTILHTVCGDLGPPDLHNETEGYPFLQFFLGRGDGEHSDEVTAACMSLIDAQNSGWINDDGKQQTFWYTPLGVSILYNNLACAKLLLEVGADPNIPGEWGEPPIYFAVRNDSLDAVNMLLSYGAKITAPTYSQIRSNQVEAALRSGYNPRHV